MAKTYTNRQLVGGNQIKNDYQKINLNADELNADLTDLYAQGATLQSNIDSQGTTLQSNIDSQGATLQSNIDTEEQNRITADGVLDARIDNIIAQSGTSDTEVVDARQSTALSVTYPVLKDRFEAIESDLQVPDTTPFTTQSSIESLPVGAVEGKVSNFESKGLTLVNIVQGQDILNGNSVTWDSVLNDLYYDSLNEVILTGTGASMNATNSSGATADMMIIHLNATGVQSYTEAQMIDLVRSGYFEGIANVENPVVESVGKNLFDKSDLILNSDNSQVVTSETNTGVRVATTSSGTFRRTTYKITKFLKPNTTFRISRSLDIISGASNSQDAQLRVLGDGIDVSIPKSIINYTSVQFTTPSNITDISLVLYGTFSASGSADIEFNDIQLEEGTSATAYEPYQSSKSTANVPLRGFHSILDRIFEYNGQIFKEKNVEESQKLNTTVINTTNLTGAKSNGSFIAHQTDGVTLTGVIDGSVTLTADATVQYELATPEIINLTEQGLTSGELFSFENGTVYNSSDTFHGNVSFDVPTNRGAQIESLLDSAEYQAKRQQAQDEINAEFDLRLSILEGV